MSILEFYWKLGRDIVTMRAESVWGSGFFNRLSLDFRDAFPVINGFSVTNLKYIKRWYEYYSPSIRQQAVDELQMPEKFAFVPWGHHIEKPIGVATYELQQLADKLPTIEEIEKQIENI